MALDELDIALFGTEEPAAKPTAPIAPVPVPSIEDLFGMKGVPSTEELFGIRQREVIRLGAQPTTPAQEQEKGQFRRGVEAGVLETRALGSAAAGAVGELLGFDEFAEERFQSYDTLTAEASRVGPRVRSVEDIGSVADFVAFSAGLLGEQLPIIASIVLSGGATGIITRMTARKLLKGRAKVELEKRVADLGRKGFLTGIVGGAGALEAGGIRGEQLEAGVEGDPALALSLGGLAGALEALPIITVARALGLGEKFTSKLLRNIMGMSATKRAAALGAIVAGQEAGTELAQELIALTAREIVDEDYLALGPEGRSRMLNAAVGGGLVGGVFGGAGGVLAGRRAERGAEASDPISEVASAPERVVSEPSQQLDLPGFEPQRSQVPDFELEPESESLSDLARKERQLELPFTAVEQLNSELDTNQLEFQFDGTDEGVAALEERRRQLAINSANARRGRISVTMHKDGIITIDSLNSGLDLIERRVEVDMSMQRFELLQRARRRVEQLQTIAPVGPARSAIEQERQHPSATQPAIPPPVAEVPAVPRPRSDSTAELAPLPKERPLTEGQEGALTEAGVQFGRLSEREQSRLRRLLEKDDISGLSDREFEVLERLLAKSEGEVVERTRAQDARELDALASEVRDEETTRVRRARMATPRPERALQPAVIDRVVERFRQRVPGIRIEMLNERGLPINADGSPRVRAPIPTREQRSHAMWSRGFVDTREPEVAYIVPHNMESEERLLRVLTHETLVHSGLRLVMTQEQQERLLKLVERSFDLGEIAAKYDLDVSVPWQKMFAAEELIARMAEDGTHMPLWRQVVALILSALRQVFPGLKLSESELRLILSDMDLALRGEISQGNFSRKLLGEFRPRVQQAREASQPRAIRERSFEADQVWRIYNDLAIEGSEALPAVRAIDELGSLWKHRLMHWFLAPLQIGQKLPLAPVKDYMVEVEKAWNTKITEIVKADDIVSKWRGLGKDQAQRLARAELETTVESFEKGRRFTEAELSVKFERLGMSPEAIGLYKDVETVFDNMLERIEPALLRTVVREVTRGVSDPDAFVARYKSLDTAGQLQFLRDHELSVEVKLQLDDIIHQVAEMRNRNYFPLMRFGQFAVTAKAVVDGTRYNGKVFKKGETVLFETYESVRAQREGLSRVERELPGARVTAGKLKDEEFAFLGLPPALMTALRGKDMNLSNDQRKALKEIFLKFSPGRSFLNHLTRRKGTAGYSEDAMRVFAAYMMNAANHLARVEHHIPLQVQLQKMDAMAASKDPDTGEDLPLTRPMNAVVMGEIRDYFHQHNDYMMNPGNDWAAVRAAGFLWYLGANPKSAFVNLTQIPMATYPWLAARFGDADAISSLTRAMNVQKSMLLGRSAKVSPELSDAITRGTNEGFLDESFATTVAGIAEAPALFRMMPGDTGATVMNKVSYYGSFLFHRAEQFNRRATFDAAWTLSRERGFDLERSYQTAKEAVQSSQFEYAKWNRAKFMRGKKSVFFLFWQYMQSASFLAFGGHGSGTAMRFWLMLMLMAGIQGLPFAEIAMDLFDFGATQLKKATGSGDPRTSIREDLREFVQELGANPDLAMHGLGRYYGLGPLHLLSAIGVPVPNVDVSASLSLGRPIPGLEPVLGEERDPDKKLARTLVEVGGPAIAAGYNFWRLAVEEHPDVWKSYERAFPAVMKNASRAIRFGVRGEERLSTGAEFLDFEDMGGRAEQNFRLIAQAAGFSPTELNQKYELRAAQEDARRHHTVRRALLLQNLGYASVVGDREGVADARAAIRRYNASRPPMPIRRDDIKQSLRQRRKRALQTEVGLPNEKRLRPLFREIAERFPQSVDDQT